MLRRIIGIVLVALAVSVPASAQDVKLPEIEFGRYHALVIGNNDYQHLRNLTTAVGPSKTLVSLQQKLETARGREEALKQQLKTGLQEEKALTEREQATAEQLAQVRRRLVVAARELQGKEAALTTLEQDLAGLNEKNARMRAKLEVRLGQRSEVLGAIPRIARFPPEAMLVLPAPPIETVRGLMAFRGLEPTLRRQAARLKADLKQLAAVRAKKLRTRADLAEAQAALKVKESELTRLQEEIAAVFDRTLKDRRTVAKLNRRIATQLGEQAKDITELIKLIEKLKRRGEEEAPRPKPKPRVHATPAPALKPLTDLELTSTGSGFYVSGDGYVVTNEHVVDGCKGLAVKDADEAVRRVTVVASDADSDLALLKDSFHPQSYASFRKGRGVGPGESVTAIGFPLVGYLSSTAKITTGIVNAESGPRDDPGMLQISAPIQPGNSGGPLLDNSGRLVGVVVSRTDERKVAELFGQSSQNVNFAIKARLVRSLLDAHGVNYRTEAAGSKLDPAGIYERARPFTVLIGCWK